MVYLYCVGGGGEKEGHVDMGEKGHKRELLDQLRMHLVGTDRRRPLIILVSRTSQL